MCMRMFRCRFMQCCTEASAFGEWPIKRWKVRSYSLSPDSLADRNVAVAASVWSHHVTRGHGNYIFTDRFSIATLCKFQWLQLLFGRTEGPQVHSSGKKKVWVFWSERDKGNYSRVLVAPLNRCFVSVVWFFGSSHITIHKQCHRKKGLKQKRDKRI